MSETLSYSDKITRVGYTTIDGVRVMQHNCSIDADNPEKMSLTNTKLDAELYKANRATCRDDVAEFEDAAYELQETYMEGNE